MESYTRNQEIVNGLIHGIGILFGVSGLPVLTAIGTANGNTAGRFEIISTVVYLLMGWIMVVGGRTFFDSIPTDILIFICIGGGLYSVGVIFYLWDKHTFTHAVWHCFVLAGAVCHYVAVLLTL